jgi:hypothetical protein
VAGGSGGVVESGERHGPVGMDWLPVEQVVVDGRSRRQRRGSSMTTTSRYGGRPVAPTAGDECRDRAGSAGCPG